MTALSTLPPASIAPYAVDGARPGHKLIPSLQAVDNRLRHVAPAAVALARWQAVVEGARVRRFISVHTLGPGVIGVNVRATPGQLQQLGLQVDQAADAQVVKRLSWISLDPQRHVARVVQGDALTDPLAMETPASRVRINGGFFNFRHRACADAAEALPVVRLRTAGGSEHAALPLPAAFAADYAELHCSDGSSLTCAPRLGVAGVAVFAQRALGHPDYRLPPDFSFEKGDQIAPGVLWHAQDANPRAAISVPQGEGDGRVRLVVAPMEDRSCAASGWTLPAFSTVLARLDRLQQPPNASLNLDGGESVALVAWVAGEPRLDVRQTVRPRAVGNLLEFVPVPRHGTAVTGRAECVKLSP